MMLSSLNLIAGLDRQVIILALGRLASAVGSGLTLFYAPIFFVNIVGMSATNVGIGIGVGGAFGVLGRILGGMGADSPKLGRKKTLLAATSFLACGAAFFAATDTFWQFVVGNILTGLGIGFYWPAAEALISDVTEKHRLNEAFGLTRLADYIGLGLGVVLGGLIIGFHSAYRILFILDSISYVLLFAFVLRGVVETISDTDVSHVSLLHNWYMALKDSRLVLYAFLNLIFTNNILQVSSTLPLYLTNFVGLESNEHIGSASIPFVFSTYIIMVSLLIMPIAKFASPLRKALVLVSSCLVWSVTFAVIAALGIGFGPPLIVSLLVVALFATANALYGPSASSLVVELAPEKSKATYLSINSLCWGVSGSFGPAIGLAALDKGIEGAIAFWISLSALSLLSILGLLFLNRSSPGVEAPTS